MNQNEKNRLRTKLVHALDKAWSTRMLSPGEKIQIAEELTDRLCEGPGWMTRQILARKADLPLPPEDSL